MNKALKALLKIKNADTIYVGCVSDIYTKYPFECNEIEKSLKALEIIKNKEIDVLLFKDCPDLDEYNEWASYKAQLSKEEFDLLKEML